MSDPVAYLFRVQERRYAGPVDEFGDPVPGVRGEMEISLHTLPVAKVTPKGWRLECGRFVLRDARKRFACPTVDEAFVSFVARKDRQARIHMARAADALEAKNGALRLQARLTETLGEKRGRYYSVVDRTCWLDTVEILTQAQAYKKVVV
ncbi:hypothetical protein [Microcystis phage MJing1]|nr:hypothetical protein [Microcystis phage MJing1]